MIVPPEPTTQTSFDPLPHTPVRRTVDRFGRVGLTSADHARPSPPWRMVPPAPTAHMSFDPLPHTPVRGWEVPLGMLAQTSPFQCNVSATLLSASWPTIQASLGPLLPTARSA